MSDKTSQLINIILILSGGAMVVVENAGEEKNVNILIIGFVLLMFGLYRATNHWSLTKDDHKKEDQNSDDAEDRR